jgi:transglutaminase-like putative cysteine protease
MRTAAVLSIALAALAVESRPRTRTFHFEYKAMLESVSPDTRDFEFWMPLPHDDPYQQIESLRVDSSYPYTLATDERGNRMLHIGVRAPRPFSVTVALDATRKERLVVTAEGQAAPVDRPEELAQYLKPDRLVPIDNQIREWARDVVQKASAHTDLEMARAIYNHVVSTVKYDKTGQGWGRGDIYYACQERRGNCTDFHAIFIGYARALGIPARFAIGFPLPADRGEGKIAGYHCWAEFYAKGIGWVPVDASEAAKNPDKREYFFGAHDENRIELSKGRDDLLEPRQHGEPLNYFVYPYAEADGQPVSGIHYDVKYWDKKFNPE